MIASAAVPPAPPVLRMPGGELSPAPPLPGAPGAVPADLAGWEVRGVVAPVPVLVAGGLPAVRLSAGTTLVTPPVAVPAGAQTLLVVAASGAGGLVDVSAEAGDGTPPVPLGTVAPGAAAAPVGVPAGAVAGRTVRLVLDPTTAFGGAVDVAEVGPFAAPLPGWAVAAGAPAVPVRRVLRVVDEVLEVRSPALRMPGDARFVSVAVRGSGTVRLRAGGRGVTGEAGRAWRDVRAPVPAGRAAALTIRVDPGGAAVEVRDAGLVVRQVRLTGVRVRGGAGRALLTASAGRAAARLPVRVTDRGRTVGAARVAADGRVRVAVRPRPGARTLVVLVAGDRTRLGARAAARLRR